MSAQPSVPATDAGRNRRIRSLPGVLVVTGVVALVVAACGSGGGTPTAAPSAAQPTRQAVVPQTPPGAFGTAAAVSATSIEVQSRQNGQVTVKFNGDTKFTDTVAATSKDVKVGECVTVTASSGGARPAKLTARTVAITPATSTGCTLGPFRGAAGRGGGDFTGRSSSRARPPGTSRNGNNFGRAFGSVTAVNATGFTVQNAARGKNPAFTTTVTVNASTTYTRTVAATSSALAVGVCVAAVGPSDDTGAVTATAISVSKPGDNGCAGVFGGGGFRGNGNGGGEGGGPAPSQIPGGGNG